MTRCEPGNDARVEPAAEVTSQLRIAPTMNTNTLVEELGELAGDLAIRARMIVGEVDVPSLPGADGAIARHDDRVTRSQLVDPLRQRSRAARKRGERVVAHPIRAREARNSRRREDRLDLRRAD